MTLIMKQAKSTQPSLPAKLSAQVRRHLLEGLLILLAAIAIFLLLSLVTYHQTDPGWSSSGDLGPVQNAGGKVGAWIADVILYLFGYLAYLFPLMLVYGGWLIFHRSHEERPDRYTLGIRIFGFVLLMLGACSLFSLHVSSSTHYLPYSAGGIIGTESGNYFLRIFNNLGSGLLLLALVLIGFTLATGLSWLKVMDWMGHYAWIFASWVWQKIKDFKQAKALAAQGDLFIAKHPIEPTLNREVKPLIAEPTPFTIKPSLRAEKERQGKLFENLEFSGLPPLSLLEKPPEQKNMGYSKETLEKLSRLVETKLGEFGIVAEVVAVYPGPVITRFELALAAGTKASRLTSLSRDLARALSVVSVRIVEVIPGKSYVGLEIPNEKREIIYFSEIVASEAYDAAKSSLSLAIGKDIGGNPYVVDLAKMPHLLVAGTTGSGKSVGLNAMLLSILYKSTPDAVRLIMIDPKMLELSIYDGIPHLLTPVITDMKEAANALRWAIGEMDRRYRLMAALGVRNLAGYNAKVNEGISNKQPLLDPFWPKDNATPAPDLEVLPNIVILVDEFADMMMVVGKKVEELIARLAQKARAAGIHLIVATQRPSVDVITGLIKANIPTRIAFQVASRIDSRTILDQQGAEQLLGNGDMLYMATGTEPVRVHGAFVSDQEVHNVVSFLKQQGEPNYLNEILEGDSEIGDNGMPVERSEGNADEIDPLFDEAVAIVAQSRRASISNVQRRLKIGYNRAARILEQMEAQGMVSAMESNGSREVLLPPRSEE